MRKGVICFVTSVKRKNMSYPRETNHTPLDFRVPYSTIELKRPQNLKFIICYILSMNTLLSSILIQWYVGMLSPMNLANNFQWYCIKPGKRTVWGSIPSVAIRLFYFSHGIDETSNTFFFRYKYYTMICNNTLTKANGLQTVNRALNFCK